MNYSEALLLLGQDNDVAEGGHHIDVNAAVGAVGILEHFSPCGINKYYTYVKISIGFKYDTVRDFSAYSMEMQIGHASTRI